MNKIPFYEERRDVANYMKRLYDRHLTTASGGNISLRVDTDTFIITPSALDKGNLTPELIAIVKFDGTNLTPNLTLSIETKMHRAVLLARPDRNAVVHAHPVAACSFASAMPCQINTRLTAEAYFIMGDVENVPYALMGTQDLANAVSQHIKNHEVVLMENHGALAVGTDLLRAFDCMELLERAAQMTLDVKLIDQSKSLNEEQLKVIRAMR
jgi:L-fuculose-phosphate aldolase